MEIYNRQMHNACIKLDGDQWRIHFRGRNQIGAKRLREMLREGGTPSRRWGSGASPRKFFEKWMQMVHSDPIFCRVRVNFFPKKCVKFLPLKLRSSIYASRENFHLSCRGSYKAKEGSFYPLAARGGRGLPEIIFEKWMQMVHSKPISADCLLIPPPPAPKIVCYFCLQSSDLRKTWWGRNFSLA